MSLTGRARSKGIWRASRGMLLAPALFAPLALGATAGNDAGAQQRAAAEPPARLVAHYQVPAVELTREDGVVVKFPAEVNDGRPVVLAFIYTSCTSICPLTSQTLEGVQRRLGAERDRVHLVSVSIDPDEDTPARLRAYAQTYHAGPEWRHYTGTRTASESVQRAFGVYRGEKMSHPAAIFIRAARGGPWIRMDGFPTADQVFAELPLAHAAR
ncbi:MAG TPA: SCO family protein [Steroidobacteraceae bacterium]|nr:SCO family protein [Steroidobacteraceae bacterium]